MTTATPTLSADAQAIVDAMIAERMAALDARQAELDAREASLAPAEAKPAFVPTLTLVHRAPGYSERADGAFAIVNPRLEAQVKLHAGAKPIIASLRPEVWAVLIANVDAITDALTQPEA